MRITDLLQSDRVITKAQYEKLRTYGFKSVMCGRDGWDFYGATSMTENEARKWVYELRLQHTYEKKNGIEPIMKGFVIHVEEAPGEPLPDWPVELKPYKGKTDHILEAYFCNKFDIPCE